jgi:uncharacterized membrane protein
MGVIIATGNQPLWRRWPRTAALVLFAVAALLRVGLVDRQGLWADELFSLALATGHSLEHPAALADPALGDFIETPLPVPPAAYRRYLEHDSPPAGPWRVVRAAFLSDTNPPLYYLLLWGWTRAVGTSDAALRLFSAAWAVACFPVLWSLARRVGGPAASFPTCLLFTFSPLCVFYSIEGRMYSLLLFWTVCSMSLTLTLWREGLRPGPFLLWVAVGAVGLLTHYFFAFVWAAACAFLLLRVRAFPRPALCAGAALVGLLVLPWYIHLPESLANWRITSNWLYWRPSDYNFVRALFALPWRFLSIRGLWGVGLHYEWINRAMFLVLAVIAWRKLSWSLFAPRRQLLWFMLVAACLGPVAFDFLRGTYIMTRQRYALAGMPAAFLLVGFCLSRFGPRLRVAFLTLIVLTCLLGIRQQYIRETRGFEPFRKMGELVAARADPSDLVLVHSIPSGVAGMARYLESQGAFAEDLGVAAWVGQLGQRRVPESLQRLAAGRRRIFLVKIHTAGEPAPEEDWLRAHATLADEQKELNARLLTFVPRDTDRFFVPGPSPQPNP